MISGLDTKLDKNRRRLLTIWKILFVGEDEDDGVAHLSVVDDSVQFLSRFFDPIAIRAVDDEDEALRSCVVMPPQWTDLVLATNVLLHNTGKKP